MEAWIFIKFRVVVVPTIKQQRLRPAASQFVEELLVESLIGFFGAHRQENVATDELVHHFAVGRQTAENDTLLLKLDHHVLHFPVDVPRLAKKKNFD